MPQHTGAQVAVRHQIIAWRSNYAPKDLAALLPEHLAEIQHDVNDQRRVLRQRLPGDHD